jgi:DNA-directed RNA polymerase subunit alpha
MRPLTDLELTDRTMNALEDAHITTLLHLVQRTDSELLKIRGFKSASLKEVKERLAAIGLSLGTRL